jgi:transcriptional regulator with XRE-family HTH domain
MAGRTPVRAAHGMTDLGEYLRGWRQLRGLSQAQVAERARISAQTVRSLELGRGSASTDSLLRVALVLGVLDDLVNALDPLQSPLGRARATELLPRRVRRPRAVT